MVLLGEDPAILISQTTANFHTHHDLASLDRISSSLTTLRSARAMRLAHHRALAAGTTRRLAAARAERSDALASHDGAAHEAAMFRLDAAQFRAAKGVSDARAECERKEGEVRNLQRTLEGLGAAAGVESKAGGEGDVLRLKVYRGLGIDAEADERGVYRRAVVRNRSKGDVRVVSLQEGWDRAFYAGHLWECL